MKYSFTVRVLGVRGLCLIPATYKIQFAFGVFFRTVVFKVFKVNSLPFRIIAMTSTRNSE